MQAKWIAALGLVGALGAGCSAAGEAIAPKGPDFFPLTDGAYWFFDGIAGGKGIQVGIRVVAAETKGGPTQVHIAWQAPGARQADVMKLNASWRHGFLELRDTPYQLQLIPDRPKLKLLPWTWKSGPDRYRGRVVRHDGFVAAPAGRWRDVLVIDIGPADGSDEQWRWHFVRGEGPVRIEVGEGERKQILELVKQGGPRELPSMRTQKGAPATQPAAPAKAAANSTSKKPATPAPK